MKQVVFKIAAIVFSLVLVLILLEIAVRVLQLSQPRLGQQDPVFGVSYIPDQRAVNQHGVAIHIGRHGFRGPTPEMVKPDDVFRVVVLGDSFLHAGALPYEETFYAVLDRRFKDAGKNIEIINMGVEGYGTIQEYLVYRHVARRYEPDLVILFFYAGNDLDDNYPPQPHRPGYELVDGELQAIPFTIKGKRRGPLRDFLRRNLRIYTYLPDLWHAVIERLEERFSSDAKTRLLEAQRAQFEQTADVDATGHLLDQDHLDAKWQVTLKVLSMLQQEVQTDGAELALCVVPTISQTYDRYWDVLLEKDLSAQTNGWDRFKPQNLLEEFALRHAIMYIPLSREMARTARDTGTFFYIPGDYHFNATGHDFIARLIEPYIVDQAGRARLRSDADLKDAKEDNL
jgi:lysophospholipase L1-like esterase